MTMTSEQPAETEKWGIYCAEYGSGYAYFFARNPQDVLDADFAASGKPPEFKVDSIYEVSPSQTFFDEDKGGFCTGDELLGYFLEDNANPESVEFAGDY